MSATGAGARRIVVGVAGSVSAYKAPFVIRLLRRAGHEVEVVATAAALRFIGEPALAALVVNAASGEVGTASTTWAPPERLACWEYWAP